MNWDGINEETDQWHSSLLSSALWLPLQDGISAYWKGIFHALNDSIKDKMALLKGTQNNILVY